MPIIEVDHVTKEYQLGQLQSLKQSARNALSRLRGHAVEQRAPFKALDDVSFSVNEGEVLGIIGHNGAGKSTLLKLLANIAKPTRGNVNVKGKIAPLIEVGAGFVPDLTGRENVYLNGTILGLSRKEIERKFDEIVGFAEMADFIDTPVKRYSSGMQVKLAFSVATSINAEILIVDEVLAVGDLAFQRKCFDRMEDMIRRQGRTVLLVSHNIRQVMRLCPRTIMLDHGTVVADGGSKDVCDLFYEQNDGKIKDQSIGVSKIPGAHTTGDVDIVEVTLVNEEGVGSDRIRENENIAVRLKVVVNVPLIKPVFAVGVHTTDLLYLAAHRSEGLLRLDRIDAGVYDVICKIKKFPILAGVYSIRASVGAGEPRIEHYYGENLCHFQVYSESEFRADMANEGFLALDADWIMVKE